MIIYTPIIIPVQQTRQIECIIQDGIKYCETSAASTRTVGMAILLLILWMGLIIGSFIWSTNRGSAWTLLLPLSILSLPFILMIIFG